MWSVQSSLVPAAEWWDRQVVGCTSPPPPGCALLPSLGLLGLQARESWLVIRLLPPPPTAISHFFLLISPFEIVKATAEEIIKSFGLRRFEAMNKPRYSQFQECPCLLVCFYHTTNQLPDSQALTKQQIICHRCISRPFMSPQKHKYAICVNQAMKLKSSAHSVGSLLLRQFDIKHTAPPWLALCPVLTSASPSPPAAFVAWLLTSTTWLENVVASNVQ